MVVGDFPVKDKIVLITGGGSGVGLSLTRLAHAAGAKVLIGDLRLTPAAEDFVASAGEGVVFQECDVTKREDLEGLVGRAVKEWGTAPDVYVACAGVFEPDYSNFWLDTESSPYLSTAININHPLLLTRIAIRSSLAYNKPGVVCHVASQLGLYPNYGSPLYSATKHAVVGFTRSLQLADRDQGVKVVCVCPAGINTPLLTPSTRDAFGFNNQNLLLPETVAEQILKMVQEAKYPGGSIVELTTAGPDIKPLPPAYDPGEQATGYDIMPAGEGLTVGKFLERERGVV